MWMCKAEPPICSVATATAGPYDWDNMVLDPDASTPDIQRQAIGALTHDTGVAVHMSYALSGSGAYNSDVLIALTNTFGFSNARYAYNNSELHHTRP